LPDCKQVSIF